MFTLPTTDKSTQELVSIVLNWEYSLDDASDHDDPLDIILSMLEERMSEDELDALCRKARQNQRAVMNAANGLDEDGYEIDEE